MNNKPKIIIFFGAGASKVVGDFMPETPPLGNELFGELKRCFPQSWGSLPDDLEKEFKKEPIFEGGMAILWERHSQVVPQLMQHMCLYFVQLRPKIPGTTLYDKLLKEIAGRKLQNHLALSTINYECLIEKAIAHAQLTIDYFSIPTAPNSIALWKLHGSCNFWPQGISATRDVSFTRGVVFNTPLVAHADLNDSVTMCLGDNALPPVMCLYMPGKSTQVSPKSVAAIQELWADAIINAKKVIVVGIAPNESDAHIWGPLKETNADIYFSDYDGRMGKWCKQNRVTKTSQELGKDFQASLGPMIEIISEDQ